VHCPFCDSPQTQVRETRDADEAIRRRRACPACGQRFTTYERVGSLPLGVRKRDGSLQAFDADKLIGGVVRAAYPRPLDPNQLDAIAQRVSAAVRAGGGELPSQRIGELVLRELREIDPVAYVRFASVYRNFDDVTQFQAELARLERAEREDRKEVRSPGSVRA
jgi:transcriptional repressor NrdR